MYKKPEEPPNDDDPFLLDEEEDPQKEAQGDAFAARFADDTDEEEEERLGDVRIQSMHWERKTKQSAVALRAANTAGFIRACRVVGGGGCCPARHRAI